MTRSRLQKGSALSIMLILAMGVGSVVTSFLGRTLVEQSRVSQRAAHVRAYRQALGQLELAKSIINQAPWVAGQNTAVMAALGANPPVIPGTGVYVESAGPARWYRLVSCGDFADQTAAATAFMRDGTPYVSYNYYVEEHPLGISGRPQGKLHTNQDMQFYFPNGFYDGYVSSVNGYTYKAGADATNTTLAGGSDPATDVKDLLDLIDFTSLQSQAAVVTPPNLEAVVTLLDANVQIDLYDKPTIVQVPVLKTKSVVVGHSWQNYSYWVYKKVWQWVNVQKSKKVWVPVDPNATGGDVGGGGGAGGYWQTQYYWELEFKLVNVPDYINTVLKWLPIYQTQSYTVMVNQSVPGTLQSSNTYPADGSIFFISDNIKSLAGNLNGKCTVVTDHDAMINGSIRYRDSAGEPAFLNGLVPGQPYQPNPAFVRDHAFGLIAKGDIRYARTSPAIMEINASLISTNGMIGMEGIVLDASGNPTLSGAPALKTSLRRYGTIMTAKRPVATLLDIADMVIHGFQAGTSQYDPGLVVIVPPGFASEQMVMWEPDMKVEGAQFTEAGDGEFDPGLVTPVKGILTPIFQVRGLVTALNFDWGSCS